MAPVTSGLHLPGRRDRRYLERRSPRLVNLACSARARPDQLYFHTVVLPVPAVASMLPVRLNATALPPPARVAIRRPVATSHTYVLPLSSPAASVLPSGLNATAPTLMLWAKSVRVAIRRPVATFHTYALPLSSPVASMLPSGLNATALTSLIPGA